MVCPKCGMEYQEWAEECSDCHIPLVSPDGKTGKQAVPDAMRPVKLVSLSDGIRADMLEGLLAELGIPVLRRKLGSGGYMQTYMGFSVFGEEIYVDEEDYERAEEVLGVLNIDEAGPMDEANRVDGGGGADGADQPETDGQPELSRFQAGYAVKIAILAMVGIFILRAVVVLIRSLAVFFLTA